jgi:hypothetical protein
VAAKSSDKGERSIAARRADERDLSSVETTGGHQASSNPPVMADRVPTILEVSDDEHEKARLFDPDSVAGKPE